MDKLKKIVEINVSNVRAILLSLFVIAIFFDRTSSIIILSLYVIFWLFEHSLKRKYALLVSRKGALLPIGLFLLYFASLLYSTDKDFHHLEKYLLLIIIPLVIGSTRLKERELRVILLAFIFGLILFIVIGALKALLFYSLPTEHFSLDHLPHQLSKGIHTPYLALYIVLANLFTLRLFERHHKKTTFWVVLSLSLFLFILSSRTALASNTFLILSYLYFRYEGKNKRLILYSAVTFLLSVATFSFFFFPHFKERLTGYSIPGNGIYERVITFKASFIVLSENVLIGVGIGDTQTELNKAYTGLNVDEKVFNLNSHNQFLSTSVSLGILGACILLSMFAYPLYIGYRKKHFFENLFFFVTFLSFMTESIFARYWGISIFVFFYTIFVSKISDYPGDNSV